MWKAQTFAVWWMFASLFLLRYCPCDGGHFMRLRLFSCQSTFLVNGMYNQGYFVQLLHGGLQPFFWGGPCDRGTLCDSHVAWHALTILLYAFLVLRSCGWRSYLFYRGVDADFVCMLYWMEHRYVVQYVENIYHPVGWHLLFYALFRVILIFSYIWKSKLHVNWYSAWLPRSMLLVFALSLFWPTGHNSIFMLLHPFLWPQILRPRVVNS